MKFAPVVIVTIAIEGSASILVTDDPMARLQMASSSTGVHHQNVRRDFHFRLCTGHAYAIADDARNKCLHGVLADPGCESRESLNLRFGLHLDGLKTKGIMPCQDIDVPKLSEKADDLPRVECLDSHGRAMDCDEVTQGGHFCAWDEILKHWQ